MKKILIISIALLLIGCSQKLVNTADVGQVENNIDNEQLDVINKTMALFPNNTQLSIAIIENGAVKYVGVKKENDTISQINNQEKVFEIGSISKVFTSVLLANFVIEEQIGLDDLISEHIDLAVGAQQKVSFKSLANHTSGLPRLPSNLDLLTADINNPYKNYDDKDLQSYLSEEVELNTEPGLKYGYSNLGAGALGYVLSKISNRSYEELLTEKICNKYLLLSTTTEQAQVSEDLIKGLDYSGNIASNWDMNALVGAGGILSSVSDLSKFLIAQFDDENRELLITHKPTFTISQNMDIGLGWHIIKKESTNNWLWHNGGTGGYTSSMTIDLKKKNGVIILSNVSAFNQNNSKIDELGFELMGY